MSTLVHTIKYGKYMMLQKLIQTANKKADASRIDPRALNGELKLNILIVITTFIGLLGLLFYDFRFVLPCAALIMFASFLRSPVKLAWLVMGPFALGFSIAFYTGIDHIGHLLGHRLPGTEGPPTHLIAASIIVGSIASILFSHIGFLAEKRDELVSEALTRSAAE